MLGNIIFWGKGRGTAWLCGCVPKKEGGVLVFAGSAPSIHTVGSLLRTPNWPPEIFAKGDFGEFTSMEKYTPTTFEQIPMTRSKI